MLTACVLDGATGLVPKQCVEVVNDWELSECEMVNQGFCPTDGIELKHHCCLALQRSKLVHEEDLSNLRLVTQRTVKVNSQHKRSLALLNHATGEGEKSREAEMGVAGRPYPAACCIR